MKRQTLIALVNLATVVWLVVLRQPRSTLVAVVISLLVVNLAAFAGFSVASKKNDNGFQARSPLFKAVVIIAWVAMIYWIIEALQR